MNAFTNETRTYMYEFALSKLSFTRTYILAKRRMARGGGAVKTFAFRYKLTK